MSNWYSIVFGLIMLGLIIVFHEFGHFIVAKKNGVGVVEFAVGMGPVIFSKIKNGTRYALRAVPFGGACMMLGDDNGIPDPDNPPDLKDEAAFPSKSVWVRISVIFAGPFFNFILAYILSVIVLGIAGVDKPVITSVLDGYPAKEAGMMAGDQIIKINNTRCVTARDISLYMNDYEQGTDLTITVKRNGEKLQFSLTPKYNEEESRYMLGVSWSSARTKTGTLETLGYSLNEVCYWIKLTIKSLGMMFTGGASVNDLSGPVGVVGLVDDTVEAVKEDGALYIFLNLANLCILLSANIGVMNLLPIPALDGGRLLFLIIEAFRGKPIDKTKEGYVHIAGFIFLFLLMIFVLFNDLRKMIFGG